MVYLQGIPNPLSLLRRVYFVKISFFGVCIIAAELKVKVVLEKLSFLKSLIGRGLFNVL
jgi:hypothetical protein